MGAGHRLPVSRTAEIAAFLDQQNVRHRITDNESTVLVPSADVYTLRNELASQQMLDGGESAGFKLLDTARFGQSNHMEMRTYDRAVSGELEKVSAN